MKNSLKRKHVEDDDSGWEPRAQPGGIYCSPRCGCKCTRADFDRANRDAQALADKLGDGWATYVWENGGWHWQVTKGACAKQDAEFHAGGMIVRQSKHDKSYCVEFRSAPNGTNALTQFFAEARTAEDAIGNVRQDVRTFISRIEADLAASI